MKLATERTQRDAQKLEQELLESGALVGLSHEFIVREGDVWEQLQLVIRQKRVDLVVTGTHGRGGLGKLLLGFGRHLRIGTTTTVPLYTTAAELRVIDVLAQHDPHARLIGY